jgi:protein-L-isoaspartate(D-aspartate) O-methyltransferase
MDLSHLSPGHSQLVRHLCGSGVLRTPAIIQAFIDVDRASFTPDEHRGHAYEDVAIPLAPGASLSQPSTVAFMLELLQPRPNNSVLEVGAGSGFQTALLAHLVGPAGTVYAVELQPNVATITRSNLEPCKLPHVSCIEGDGSQGIPEHAPFDRIIVAAAATHIPEDMRAQLAVGGRLVVPVGNDTQDVVVLMRLSDQEFDEERYPGFSFSPLIEQDQ